MLSTMVIHLKTQPLFVLLLSFIGFITFLKNFIIFLKWIFITFLRTPKNLVQSYGSWALITGSTDGIGKAFAFQLAQKGLNLILVARNLNKLQQVSSEIKTQNPNIKVKIIVVDFSFDVTKGIQEMKKGIEGLDIGVLINNVGVTYPRAMFFHEVDENIWKNIVKVNLEGTTLVTTAVLPSMIGRKKGAIVNIGSGASIVVPSHPLFSIYAATKANRNWSFFVGKFLQTKSGEPEKYMLLPSYEIHTREFFRFLCLWYNSSGWSSNNHCNIIVCHF
ncbi:very-long-chain 3-oxoacyl-CoA reductase 1 isoform X2 [Solanum lycopersicum]|uniref:very-long-chain 3-oxoacyl-CoA reductase 1 isoform X2 n=1 Tax=Solanum lycopersicum TaxID=4081 RepID=UPI003747CFB1